MRFAFGILDEKGSETAVKKHRLFAPLCLFLLIVLASFAPAFARGRDPASVGVVFATGEGDSMYTSSVAGVKRAQSDMRIHLTSYLAGYDPSKYEQAVRDAAAHNRLIIAVGGALSEPVSKAADEYPDVDFVLIDAKCPHPRVASIVFYQCEASYLAGMLAARITERELAKKGNAPRVTGVVLGERGEQAPVMLDFLYGFVQGAREADPKIQVLAASAESWNDPKRARELAMEMHRRGANVIFQAAGRSGQGVIEAAFTGRFYVIGVDEAQEKQAPGTVLTAVLKHFDQAIYDAIAAKYEGHLRPGTTLRYRLWNRGVGLSWTTNTLVHEDLRRELEGVSYRIIDSHIKVVSCYDDKGSFKNGLKPIPAGVSVVPASYLP